MLAFRRSKPLLFAAVLALIAVASLASPAWAQDPPGNNGTVKIDDVPFDDLPNNEPHVGCTFQVDFYGYDEGDLDATVTGAVAFAATAVEQRDWPHENAPSSPCSGSTV